MPVTPVESLRFEPSAPIEPPPNSAVGGAEGGLPGEPTSPGGTRPRGRPPRPRPWAYVVVIVVVVAGAAGGAYFFTAGFHAPGTASSGKVLVPDGTQYSIPVGQYNAVSFIITGNATVTGTIYEAFGLQLYRMTPAQYEHLVVTLNYSAGWEWTSGPLANNTVYNLSMTAPAGQWELVFANPNGLQTFLTTLVGFYTNLVLTS